MADKTTGLLDIDSQYLAAKFICMGIIRPEDLNQMTRDRLDYIVTKLPAVYECSFAVRNRNDELLAQRMFDSSPEGLNNQIVNWLKKQDLVALPEQREVNQCTVEAWQGLFKRPQEDVNFEELSKSFSKWGIKVDPQVFEIAFEANLEQHLVVAEQSLDSWNKELVSRLVVTGMVSPLDIDNVSFSETQEIINSLPALNSRDIVFNVNGSNERKEFIDINDSGLDSQVAKYLLINKLSSDDIIHQDDDIRFGLDWLDYFRQNIDQIDPTRNGVRFSLEGLGTPGEYQTSLAVAESDLKARLESYSISEDIAVADGVTIYSQEVVCEADESYTKRFAALTLGKLDEKIDRFLQENKIENSLKLEPGEHSVVKEKSHQLRELQNGLKSWGTHYTAKHLEYGFSNDIERINNFAKLKFCKALISKTVAAGIIKAIPMEEWKNLDFNTASRIVESIPCGGKIVTSGDWLKLFRHSKDEINKEDLEQVFKNANVKLDEEKVAKCFQEKVKETASLKKRIVFASEQEKITLYTLIKKKRVEPISRDEMDDMTSKEAKEIIKEYDVDASFAQKIFVKKLSEEEKIMPPLTEKDIAGLKGHEAGVLISSTMEANGMKSSKSPYVQFASKEQRDALRTYMNRGKIERMDLEEWKKLSFEKAQELVSSISTNDPLTSGQKKTILDLHSKSIIDLSKKFNNPVITEKNIDSLTFGEASKLIGNVPASEKQVETVEELISDGRLKKDIDVGSLTKNEASKLISTGFKETTSPGGSPANQSSLGATDKQIAKINVLVKANKIPTLTPEQEKSLSRTEASKIIGSSPASQAQRNKVTELVSAGKLEKIPYDKFAKMTSSQANEYIKGGLENKNPASKAPEQYATAAQSNKLKELYDTGKIDTLPGNPTSSQASKLISDAVASNVITSGQRTVVMKMIERKQIKEMPESEIKGMTQGKFSELLKNNPMPAGNKDVTCSSKEYKQLAELVKGSYLEKIPMSNWKTLTKKDAEALIKKGNQTRDNQSMGRER